MNVVKNIINIHGDNDVRQRITPLRKVTIPFIMPEPIMPKEVEKEIILDAIGSFILSCDTEETNSFIKAIADTVTNACIIASSNHRQIDNQN